MRIVVFSQYYRCVDPARQAEIDACLRGNLNHPLVSRVVLFVEQGAPAVEPGSAELVRIPLERRLSYADWLRRLPEHPDAIALLLNADIQLAEGLEHLPACFERPDSFLALTRYNPLPGAGEEEGASLNDYPHWTQDCWGVRSDAPITEGLLHACGFPLGFPGCDNRIAHVMWSHGFTVRNPCYHIRTLHRQASTARSYDKTDDRLYGGVTYVHPSLAPREEAELEHALWTRSLSPTGGVLINRQGAGGGVQSLLDADAAEAEPFQLQQRFSGLSWSRGTMGSVHARPSRTGGAWPSEDTIFLPLGSALDPWVEIQLADPAPIEQVCLRLPRRCPEGYRLELIGTDERGESWCLLEEESVPLAGAGRRTFVPLRNHGGRPPSQLRLRLCSPTAELPDWGHTEGCELVLFGGGEGMATLKSLRRIAEPPADPQPPQEPPLRWLPRSGIDLDHLDTLARFGRRFRVLRAPRGLNGTGEEQLVFEDAYGPMLQTAAAAGLPLNPNDFLSLFLWGFGQPLQELRPDPVHPQPRHGDHCLHWWPGSRTEEDAHRVHALLRGPQRDGDTLHLYLALPWATFLETGRIPEVLLQAHRSRSEAIAAVLAAHGLRLEVHSVCQHPLGWQRAELFESAGVTTLWLSHRPPALEQLGRLQLRSWHLCPFGDATPAERPLLVIRPPEQRPFLASFLGQAGGLDDATRHQLAALHHHHRWHVQIGPHWPEETVRQGEAWDRYDRLLSDSVFSLCPAEAGPVSERFWDSLAVGAIPVLIGEEPPLPELRSAEEALEWDAIALWHPADQLDSLPDRLRALPAAEIGARSRRALEAHHRRQQSSCFGEVHRPLPTIRREVGPADPRRPCVEVPLHGPRDRLFWRGRKCAFYDIVIEWYLRGLIDLHFSEHSYFWWGRNREILLFERDLIINLRDSNSNPPRWAGEISYQHAFFANQYHLASPRHHRITYWSYAPVLVEQLRSQGRRCWEERHIQTFFAGTIENETQEFFRNRFTGWGAMIEVYACADKLNQQEPNPYGLNDYLEHVQSSRFAISFRGNGPKCYREIEAMALGTPLILTEGIETDYPEPLLEGVHYRLARCPEDIPLIVAETEPEQWERMSRACWEWFSRNGTIERLFETLSSAIASLDLQGQRHQRVRIRADRLSGQASRAARSLAILDPQAEMLFEEDPGDCPLQLAPEDLVIAELPLPGREGATPWRVPPEGLREFCRSIAASDHPAHHQLLTLVGVRLPNYRIRLEGPTGEIDPFDRLENGALQLRSDQERAILQTDFDWSRRCSMKYPDRRITITGPARLSQARITAVLHYRRDGREWSSDLSDHFTEWHVAHGRLIAHQELYRALKLWEYEDCELVTIRGCLEEGENTCPFEYRLNPCGPDR